MRKLSREDLKSILFGCTVLGSGGGGDYEKGVEIIEDALNEGYEFVLADNSEIPEDGWIGTPYSCGSVSPVTEETIKKFEKYQIKEKHPEVKAFKVMEQYMGKEFYGVIATELGGFNTAIGFNVAARLGKPIVDGDPSGRCVPELQHTTYNLVDLPICPITVANEFGDIAIIPEIYNDERAEAYTRALAMASFDGVCAIDHPAQWKDLKNAIVNNSITYALNVGKVSLEAQKNNKNIAYAVADAFDGYILFEGIVTKNDWEDKDGFTVGDIYIDGTGKFEGSTFRIWMENENIMSWLNDEYYVTAPDLINVIRNDTNEALTNPNAEEGMPVTVFGLKAPKEWRTARGIDCFGPRSFGFDTEYKKLEEFFE